MTPNGALASYQQIELVVLGFGLAFRGLWIAQFPDNYTEVPPYITASPYPFTEYQQLSYKIDNLLSGYSDAYVAYIIFFILLLMHLPSTLPTHRLTEIESALPSRPLRLLKGPVAKDVVGQATSSHDDVGQATSSHDDVGQSANSVRQTPNRSPTKR